ncbi:helix-turn-helix transcriptional regulator [Natrononativus amylolyticus]|uniref:helix-turn-helix transcriptional regulator n=1 Tax=Natrononativus amylolyticus TaxID=2963434 RepID=UPI0020CD5D9C|nr:membrane-associated protein/domain-like protein [Natrononativus amylolyticus]
MRVESRVPVFTRDTSISFETVLAALPVYPLETGAHLAALFGIVVLAVLGAGLVLRNRLETTDTTEPEVQPSRGDVMTDRERVRELVTENGGRMKQSAIVDSVDWSKAKVSRLLTDLEEDDEITKLRLGRENLVCLRGHEPPASRSSEQPPRE